MGSAEKQSELWGRKARDWAELQEIQHLPLWAAMLTSCNTTKGTKVVDIGCGAGRASKVAADMGAVVKGIDATPQLIEHARELLPEADFSVGDIEDLPYGDSEFDVVFAANIIQYAENRIAAMNELKRVCKPGGHIIAGLFASPDKVKFSSLLGAIRDSMPNPPTGGGPFELSMDGALEKLFGEVDLEIDLTDEVDCTFRYDNWNAFCKAALSGGPTQAILGIIGEQNYKDTLKKASSEFATRDGKIVIGPNAFKLVRSTL